MGGFKTKARAIDLLGEKQIKDEATAISELFKNAHDADARNAEISVDTQRNTLVLWDNGHGMTLDDVENKWLTVGTTSKLAAPGDPPKKSKSGRVLMGEKGIGRLAIAMLGKQMVMITRAAGGPYVMAYIHWDVFTNGELFLDDTIVPIVAFDDLTNVYDSLDKAKELQWTNVVSNNPRVTAAWEGQYADLGERILGDIQRFSLARTSLAPALENIADHGTLFYVTDLKEKWDRLFSGGGERAKRKRKQLGVMMSSFVNSIQLFEGQSVETHLEDLVSFTPALRVNGVALVSPVTFTAEDLERYDYAIVGEITEGVFQGHALRHGWPPEPVKLALTNGMVAEDMTDCGPFKVSIFCVEGTAAKSHLDPSIHRNIHDKLDYIGGIYVYRDGLRVLPYGTPEFDFLEIEERRGKNYGRYVFSMRNIFGYIAISKEANPGLQDKSSREGLIESPQFYFFRAALMNLLVWWGKDYLNGQERIDEAREKVKREKEEEEDRRRREADRQSFIKTLKKQAEEEQRNLVRVATSIRTDLTAKIPTPGHLGVQVVMRPKEKPQSYFQLWSMLQDLEDLKRDFERRISDLEHLAPVYIEPRFRTDAEVTQIERGHNDFVSKLKADLQQDLDARWTAAHEFLQGQLHRYLDHVSGQLRTPSAATFLEGLRQAVNRAHDSVSATRESADRLLESSLSQKEKTYQKQIEALSKRLMEAYRQVRTVWSPRLPEAFQPLEEDAARIRSLFERFSRLESNDDLAGLAGEIQSRVTALSAKLEEAQHSVDIFVQHALADFTVPALDVLGQNCEVESVVEDRQYLALLERHVQEMNSRLEEYRGLVATGIAAEVVNHEFNQLYEKIHTLFDSQTMRNLKGQYQEIAQIEDMFQHIELRHRYLSPMYRRARIYRQSIVLRDLAEKVRGLFQSQIDLYSIQFLNEIDPNFVVYESEPILYPVFINILNNAIYWMMNRQDRTILLRSDRTRGALYLEDSGKGIEPENAERVFELFYTTRLDGRGIGLHLVRELLASRNHQIMCVTAATEKELSGACFRVTFDSRTVIDGGNQG